MSEQPQGLQAIPEKEQLLQVGRTALMAGDAFTARNAFREAIEQHPDSVEAWIGLSASVPILAEKEQYLNRALELAPGHPEAEAALRYIRQLQSEGLRLAPAQSISRHAPAPALPAIELPQAIEAEPAPTNTANTEAVFCYMHPDRETGLHCIQCNRPICGQCAKMTAVGQLCPECRKERRPSNYKISNRELIKATLTSLAISTLISALMTVLPGFGIFLNLILGWLAGQLIIRAIDRVTRLKRGPAIQISVGVSIVVGFLLGAALIVPITMLTSPEGLAALAQIPITSIVPVLFMHVFADIGMLITAAIATVIAVRGLK